MTEEQKTMVLAAIDAAEIWESATGKKKMTLRVGSEFFKTLKELVADRLDYSKHIPVDEPCEDTISRKHLLSEIDDLMKSPWLNNGKDDRAIPHYGYVERKEAVEVVRDLCIKAEPFVTPKHRWIPLTWDESKCESSYPDDMDGCWAIFTDGKNMSIERGKKDAIDHFFPSGRWFNMSDAIAWMPLPKYEKGE